MNISKLFKQSLLSILLIISGSAFATPTYINILTGGTSGVYYPIGVALSQLYSKGITDSKTAVQATKASVENLNLLQSGRGELAFAIGDSVEDAWNGVADAGFNTPLKKLRAIAAIYPNYVHIVASADSGITKLSDLKGKRISVGAPKSGTELNARVVFAAAGLTYKDFKQVQYLPYAESMDLIKNRQLDATLQTSGLGMAALRDLAVAVKINFIPIDKEVVDKIKSNAYQADVIPANTYDHQTVDVPTVSIVNMLVTHSGVTDEVAYKMTKLMFDNLEKVGNSHSAAKGISLDKATKGLPIPLHPGAERFYKEAGVLPK